LHGACDVALLGRRRDLSRVEEVARIRRPFNGLHYGQSNLSMFAAGEVVCADAVLVGAAFRHSDDPTDDTQATGDLVQFLFDQQS
jgi:hypothetical protein